MSDTSCNPCKYSRQKYSTVDTRQGTVVFAVDFAEIREDNIRRKINELSGYASPCLCSRCNPNTSVHP